MAKVKSAIFLLAFFAILVLSSSVSPLLFSQSKKEQEKQPASNEKVDAAIEKGLEYLAKQQSRGSGAFGTSYPVASTSMACLAFMAAGHTPGRGKYGDVVERGLRFILRTQNKHNGFITEGAGSAGMGGGSRMHGHGYALLFLSELYGMQGWKDEQQREDMGVAIKKAVKLAQSAQSKEGGWGYEPAQGGFGGTENSVIPCVVAGLRAARNAGFNVDIGMINKAIDYTLKCTGKDGMVQYNLQTPGGRIALTAAGMSIMSWLGVAYKKDNKSAQERLEKGLKCLLNLSVERNANPMDAFGGHGMFATYYTTIAMYQKGGNHWRKWWAYVSNYLVGAQSKGSGGWGSQAQLDESLADAYAIQALCVPRNYLPLFQR